jgi:hypothetical protein
MLDTHIALLKRYNDVKDTGMRVVGILAEREGRRVGDVLERFGGGDLGEGGGRGEG